MNTNETTNNEYAKYEKDTPPTAAQIAIPTVDRPSKQTRVEVAQITECLNCEDGYVVVTLFHEGKQYQFDNYTYGLNGSSAAHGGLVVGDPLYVSFLPDGKLAVRDNPQSDFYMTCY